MIRLLTITALFCNNSSIPLRLLKGPLSLDKVPALVHQMSLCPVEGRLAGRQEHPLHGGGHTTALDKHLLRTPLLLKSSEGLIGPDLEGDISGLEVGQNLVGPILVLQGHKC